MDDAAHVEIHDYRGYGRLRYFAFVLPMIVLLLANVCAGAWMLPASTAAIVEVCALVGAAALAPFIWFFLKLVNERVEVAGTRITRRDRFGRKTFEFDLSDVTEFRAKGKKAWRRRIVETGKGKLVYGALISRRAELDRLFMAQLGMPLPSASPLPRHWEGSASYAINPSIQGFMIVFGLLGGFALFLNLWTIWIAVARHRPFEYFIPGLPLIFLLAMPVLVFATQYRFRRIEVANDSVRFVGLFSRRGITVPLDAIQSVDMVNSGSGCAAVVYTPDQALNMASLDPMLGIVLAWLSRVTGSPDP
ncbi:MAG TPA: hypothetical protein VKT78_05315 [Fimbriimonadaceae bacterium]|nr:hypothetical protein [Fimbriimonadaceae bacterium]